MILNRRNCPRGIPREAVLVRFGGTNWGKLVNISEEGMGFEFTQPPSTEEMITFELESMDYEASRLGDDPRRSAVQANGWVKWSCQFERTAGVQFVGLAKDTGQQIRQWLSMDASSSILTEGNKVIPECLRTRSCETPLIRQEFSDTQGLDSKHGDSSFEQSRTAKLDEQSGLENPPASASRINRTALLCASACLAIVAALTLIAVFRFPPARVAANSESIRKPPVGDMVSPYTVVRPATNGTPAFEVEVVETAGRRFLLNFSGSASANVIGGAVNVRGDLNAPGGSLASPPTKPQAQAETVRNGSSVGVPLPSETRSDVAPNTPAPVTTLTPPAMETERNKEPGSSVTPMSSAPAEASTPPEAGILSEGPDSLGNRGPGIVASATKPISAAVRPMGGQVQQARLISSVPPVYPPFAKLERISGNVTINALIDSTGKVTNMRVLSGPVPLQEAAKDALRQWRFEPARLNGEPISTSLEVTVKFQLVNSAKQPIR